MQSQIIIESPQGYHNSNPDSLDRLIKGNGYRDLSTICVVPTRGMISAKVTQSWMGLMSAMNQKFTRVFIIGLEIGEAYNTAIEQILAAPALTDWKYMLTLEEDNMPPPDGLLKLYENIDRFAALGGLYWTKGEGGQPMIYGEGKDGDLHFRPQPPTLDIQECDGLGMGFTLFKLELFRNPALEKPWFRTYQEWQAGVGGKTMTQDLFFFEKIRKLGYRVACDTRVKVGHYDSATDVIW